MQVSYRGLPPHTIFRDRAGRIILLGDHVIVYDLHDSLQQEEEIDEGEVIELEYWSGDVSVRCRDRSRLVKWPCNVRVIPADPDLAMGEGL